MLEGVNSHQSLDIFIRHGKSVYSNKFPDLTEEGINEIEETAIGLKEIISLYANLKLNTSPAIRAIGSSAVFAKKAGVEGHEVDVVPDLRPVDIYKFPEFISTLNDPSYQKEYEAYLLKKEFDNPDSETRICERRCDIRARAINYFIKRMKSEDRNLQGEEPTCSLHFTHFEIMSTLLSAFYGDVNNFPIEREEGPKNGEAIAIQKYSPREMVIYARSMSAKVAFSDWE